MNYNFRSHPQMQNSLNMALGKLEPIFKIVFRPVILFIVSLDILLDWYWRFWKFITSNLVQLSNPLNLWNLLFPKTLYPEPKFDGKLPLNTNHSNYSNKGYFSVLKRKQILQDVVNTRSLLRRLNILNIGYLNLFNSVVPLVFQLIDETNNIAKYEAIRIYQLSDNADYVWDRYVLHSPWCIIDKFYKIKISYAYKGMELSRDEGYVEYLKKLEKEESEDESSENEEDIRTNFDHAKKRKTDASSLRLDKRKELKFSPDNNELNYFEDQSTIVTKRFDSLKFEASRENPPTIKQHIKHPDESQLRHQCDSSEDRIVKTLPGNLIFSESVESKTDNTVGKMFKAAPPSEPIQQKIEILTYKSEPTTYLKKDATPKKQKKFRIRVKPKKPKIDDEYVSKVISEIQKIIPQNYDDGSMAPILLRLAWHCCATYDISSNNGGSNGATMRFVPEITDEGNNGLDIARGALEPIKQKYPLISYSDLWTLAGKVAVEWMGGPEIHWKGGRVDHRTTENVPPNGRLPFADKGADHIRKTFARMGFNEREAVVLSGAHAVGRCHKRISGWEGKWTPNPIKFSNDFYKVLIEEEWEIGQVPETGRVQFFNKDKSLMMLNTDLQLIKDPNFRTFVQIFAMDESLYFQEFAQAFEKLLELGIKRDGNNEIIN